MWADDYNFDEKKTALKWQLQTIPEQCEEDRSALKATAWHEAKAEQWPSPSPYNIMQQKPCVCVPQIVTDTDLIILTNSKQTGTHSRVLTRRPHYN